MILKYTLPSDETTGAHGETIRTKQEIIHTDVTNETVVKELTDLNADGFDIEITLKLKEPK